ncbi:MAG: hypothetical protein AB7S68_40540, partial [Polyangiaceae bacterium]
PRVDGGGARRVVSKSLEQASTLRATHPLPSTARATCAEVVAPRLPRHVWSADRYRPAKQYP